MWYLLKQFIMKFNSPMNLFGNFSPHFNLLFFRDFRILNELLDSWNWADQKIEMIANRIDIQTKTNKIWCGGCCGYNVTKARTQFKEPSKKPAANRISTERDNNIKWSVPIRCIDTSETNIKCRFYNSYYKCIHVKANVVSHHLCEFATLHLTHPINLDSVNVNI